MKRLKTVRIALAQINATVGDFEGNRARILAAVSDAKKRSADIVLLPELALCGYPPEDLLLKPAFLTENQHSLRKLAAEISGIVAIVGFADGRDGVFNAAAVLSERDILAVYHKICLPNYSVFDEKRNFQSGNAPLILEFDQIRIGVNICEDIWLANSVAEHQALQGGASLICNISASPYYANRRIEREEMLSARAQSCHAHVAYVNMIGGQDELVFDGGSFIYDPEGRLLARGPFFSETLLVADLEIPLERRRSRQYYFQHEFNLQSVAVREKLKAHPEHEEPVVSAAPDQLGEILDALVLGARDYMRKNGFGKAVIGLSGGIDSALTAVIAQKALGSDNVVGVIMPSRFSSEDSVVDATDLAHNLRIQTRTVGIEEIVGAYENALEPIFGDMERDITEENLQARARGNLLMALSNKFGWIVLTTGNKSETSVGYCTLYGDMAGGFAVLKDVLKTLVFALSEYVNRDGEIIPIRTITKPPSAELRPDQKDEDSLPPYSVLDEILQDYVERDRSVQEIIARGFDAHIVRDIVRLVDRNEYKRRQAPPGIKITPKAFGRDRRMPITNHFTHVETNAG